MDDDECIHGLGPVSACSVCNGRVAREAQAAADRPRVVLPAKFAGHCAVCNLPIAVGQSIAWTPDQPVVHEECR